MTTAAGIRAVASPAKRVLLVFGTRPEAIKMGPLVQALHRHPRLTPWVVVTGQHRGMLDQMLGLFGVAPDGDLDIHTPGQTLADVTTRVLAALPPVLDRLAPDVVAVQGDTASTVAAAMAAAYAGLPVVHLEAGLRSGDRTAPFPEEINRRMVTQLAALHLAATPANRAALLAEAIPAADIAVTGNTVIDALLSVTARRGPFEDPRLERSPLGSGKDWGDRKLVLVTAHRRESWGEPLAQIAAAIAEVAAAHPDVHVAWPVHANPQVRAWITPALAGQPNILLTDPLSYPDLTAVLARAYVAVTDSGGIQEEAPALGVPVLVTREVTERREVLDAGAARLVGTHPAAIHADLHELLTDPAAHQRMRIGYSPYGDGKAAERAASAIAQLVGVGQRLPDFVGRSNEDTHCAGSAAQSSSVRRRASVSLQNKPGCTDDYSRKHC